MAEYNNISEEDVSTMAETWINIEGDIGIMNEVVEAELDSIDNQDYDDIFCINDDSKHENGFIIVPEEENNDTKMERMCCLDKIIHT